MEGLAAYLAADLALLGLQGAAPDALAGAGGGGGRVGAGGVQGWEGQG